VCVCVCVCVCVYVYIYTHTHTQWIYNVQDGFGDELHVPKQGIDFRVTALEGRTYKAFSKSSPWHLIRACAHVFLDCQTVQKCRDSCGEPALWTRADYTREVPTQAEVQGIQFRWMWGPCNGRFSTYPPVMIGTVVDISHNTAEMCWVAIARNPWLLVVYLPVNQAYRLTCYLGSVSETDIAKRWDNSTFPNI
jgi:hypothetical protein